MRKCRKRKLSSPSILPPCTVTVRRGAIVRRVGRVESNAHLFRVMSTYGRKGGGVAVAVWVTCRKSNWQCHRKSHRLYSPKSKKVTFLDILKRSMLYGFCLVKSMSLQSHLFLLFFYSFLRRAKKEHFAEAITGPYCSPSSFLFFCNVLVNRCLRVFPVFHRRRGALYHSSRLWTSLK